MCNTKKKSSSLSEARRLTKKISTDMTKMVNDLTELRKATEDIKNKLDADSNWETADMMYRFYEEVAHLEDDLDMYHQSFKQMYEELGGTDTIPDPCAG